MEASPVIIQEPPTDVVELCALLQCLGFTVKSLDTSDINSSQDGGPKTVVINCQTSGLHVVLESGNAICSCPIADHQTSGLWQVSGMAAGKQTDKETGSTLIGSLAKAYRERVAKELREIMRGIREHNDTDSEVLTKQGMNKSASMIELTSPERSHLQLKVDTPTRYRSLDTLTSAKDESALVPAPGLLLKEANNASVEDGTDQKADNFLEALIKDSCILHISQEIPIFRRMCHRQSTYTIASAPCVSRRRNITSSPIQHTSSVLDSLIAAERAAEDLRSKLSMVIREIADDGNDDSSMSSLALDESKISLLKGPEGKTQFASSPNLSGISTTHESLTKSRLKRFESASVSYLAPKKNLLEKEGKIAKLRRLSPNIFKRKDTPGAKDKSQDGKNKFSAVFKPRIVTPVRIPKPNLEPSPNLSNSNRKKFSHVKSTIPRPASAKK